MPPVNQNYSEDDISVYVRFRNGTNDWAVHAVPWNKPPLIEGCGLILQVGAEEGRPLAVRIDAMDAKGLGVYADDFNISTREAASKAITATRDAINTVSMQRAQLGAIQNRLAHKVSNLDNTVGNCAAAESRIRDVDMAKEMSEFTKQNIRSQAAPSMLAQANSAPQNVLSLLQ